MTRQETLRHEFVEHIPEELEEGVLYVSITYATAAHKCACGCGREVITPFTPTDWEMTFDGETISLAPSIGNWNFECQSHYWIRRGRVRWARRWSREEIDRGRARDKARKRYREHDADERLMPDMIAPSRKPSLLARLVAKLRR
ncbi:MAG: hypothetical protein H0U00_14580 [Actinobacteria bacterium]|nr:hypothetical protein [Actinomycetota bacterium]